METVRCGFRFSMSDGLVIAIGTAAWAALWMSGSAFAPLIPLALGHFFLFCNVFRVRRSYELFWAAALVVNVAVWSLVRSPNWWLILAAQTPITLLIIALELRSTRYHGIACATLNPRGHAEHLSGRRSV